MAELSAPHYKSCRAVKLKNFPSLPSPKRLVAADQTCGLCDPDHSDRYARVLLRHYDQHPLIRRLVGPLPDRRPERARIAFGVRRGRCGLGNHIPVRAFLSVPHRREARRLMRA